MADSLPRADAAFLQWTGQFQVKVAAAPQRYEFTPQQAAELTAAWEAFDAAYRRMHDPSTRTSPAAAAKRAARATLEGVIRPMARMARAKLAGSVELGELGLRPAVRTRTRIAPPAEPPLLRLIHFDGSTVRLALADATAPTRRGKPRGVAGAIIFCKVGDDDARPVMVRQTTRPRFDLSLADLQPPRPGTRVLIGACWTNPRWQQGPMSASLELRTGYPSLMRAA